MAPRSVRGDGSQRRPRWRRRFLRAPRRARTRSRRAEESGNFSPRIDRDRGRRRAATKTTPATATTRTRRTTSLRSTARNMPSQQPEPVLPAPQTRLRVSLLPLVLSMGSTASPRRGRRTPDSRCPARGSECLPSHTGPTQLATTATSSRGKRGRAGTDRVDQDQNRSVDGSCRKWTSRAGQIGHASAIRAENEDRRPRA